MENGTQRNEEQENEMGADPSLEIETTSVDETSKREMSIIKPKRRAEASPSGATFLHIQDTSARYSEITFTCAKKGKDQTNGKAARDVLEKWIGFCGTPDIILADKGAIFARWGFPLLRDRCAIALQTVFPGHCQSLGALKGDIGILETSCRKLRMVESRNK